MNLPVLVVQFFAILAQPISASAGAALRLGYIPARRTGAVVMMNTFVGRFFDFIYGIEFLHRFPFCFDVSETIKRIEPTIKLLSASNVIWRLSSRSAFVFVLIAQQPSPYHPSGRRAVQASRQPDSCLRLIAQQYPPLTD